MIKPHIRKLSAISDRWVCELYESRGLGDTPQEAFYAWAKLFGDYGNVLEHFVDPERETWWRPPSLEDAPKPRERTTLETAYDKVVSIFSRRAA